MVYMEDNIVSKFVTKVKDKLSKKQRIYPSVNEYAFSSEEIDDLSRLNQQKIQELKQDVFSKKKSSSAFINPVVGEKLEMKELSKDEELKNLEETNKVEVKETLKKSLVQKSEDLYLKEESLKIEKSSFSEKKVFKEGKVFLKEKEEDVTKKIEKEVFNGEDKREQMVERKEISEEEKKSIGDKKVEEGTEEVFHKNSFIHLAPEYQAMVMDKWNCIDITLLDKDILVGKDLLNHNYTITFADEASAFIRKIRHDYEVVICYLIGFNNEKKGIYEKTIFSDRVEDEWKHLGSYIKILEKIRGVKK